MSTPATRRFRISDQAKQELYQVWKDIRELSGSHDSADGVVDAIRSRFRLILDFPFAGRARPEIAPEVRSFVARGGYVVYYRVTEE
ncbi:MAG: type II toxin-antitoxin system RelE/ParE family toxin [Armatimonas sp.]